MHKRWSIAAGAAALATAAGAGWMYWTEPVAAVVEAPGTPVAKIAVTSVTTIAPVEPPKPSAAVPAALATTTADPALALANGLYEKLTRNWSPQACFGALDELAKLLSGTQPGSDLANWSFDIVTRCAKTLDGERREDFLKRLVESGKFTPTPEAASLLTTYARVLREAGKYEPAASLYEWALKLDPKWSTWDSLALTRLEQARGLDPDSAERATALRAAETASRQAIDTMEPGVNEGWVLERMAEASLEQGRTDEAIAWANKALAAMDSGSGGSEVAYCFLMFNVGEIYLRAGQRETGIAYMDQAISRAPETVKQNLRESRADILETR